MSPRPTRRVAVVTLGCSRNEVDSEELAARLAGDGWELVDDAADADAVLVNTCGFVEAAKKDSIDALLAADSLREPDGAAEPGGPAGGPRAVVAVGCMAERYGRDLAESLPEADAVLGFDAYPAISAHLDAVLAGERPSAHTPRDRRALLPITPVERAGAAGAAHAPHLPGHIQLPPAEAVSAARAEPVGASGAGRRRLTAGPVVPVKLSSGCDRRCAFCAIPSFRGSHVSRPPEQVLAEAEWLAGQGARELVLVSENSTSYGKDLGDLRALEKLLPRLAAVPGIVRVRTVYLQPAELRPSLLEALLTTPGLAPYLDLSFQHASPAVLRRMRRFGGTDDFLDLLRRGRTMLGDLGARSNVIVGFPGETEEDVEILMDFLERADLDAVGVFGYSDEEGTEAAGMDGHLDPDEIERRRVDVTNLVEQLTEARAERRVGTTVEVLVEEVAGGLVFGCAGHQQADADGACTVRLPAGGVAGGVAVGDLVTARVVAAEGVDLVAEFADVLDRASVAPPGTAATTSTSTGATGAGAGGGGHTGAVAAEPVPRSRDLAGVVGRLPDPA
ncbi:ribosomal protein S12 methylthiotransferase RimO [Parafrankia colletiae]|uniref:Ribosomal protein uS12 methylthiotransferase RimO n=1 Tax=Parafrankia colletiae TaxID=573497 RepID=A0A1S1RF44_9ACTN|nr:radical SAM protein [Parafrankia colletiae]MCK9898563.1 radical SAM protein [Frankia sp. Cpl3]OHV44085.1 ribosomal protein S12 methylthiotransferase RimO [Parafrankia colletiae]